MNANGLSEDFRGITTDGSVEPGLFEIRSTGISTAPVSEAAQAFLATLNQDQQERISFDIDADEWRKWANQHIYYRDGISFEEMNNTQREAALALLAESLSARGLALSQDIMHLNTPWESLTGTILSSMAKASTGLRSWVSPPLRNPGSGNWTGTT